MYGYPFVSNWHLQQYAQVLGLSTCCNFNDR